MQPSCRFFVVKADSFCDFVLKQFWLSRGKIKALFESVSSINLTCDLWTSPNAKVILAITAHWIDNVYDLKEILLEVVEVNGAQSGLNIASYMLKSLEDFAI
jgi:hypothetical protein